MKRSQESFEKRYKRALAACLGAAANENDLVEALELGKEALAKGPSLLDLLSMHRTLLPIVVGESGLKKNLERRDARAQEFLAQAVAPFEMVNRGWHEVIERLRRSNEILEENVAERTATLRAREQQLESISAHVPGLVYQRVLRPDGSVTYPFMSGTVLTAMGATREDAMLGRVSLADFTHPDDLTKWDEAMRQSAEKLTPMHVELRILAPTGEERWLMSHSIPRREPDGSILWDAVAIDVTERRAIQQQLVKSQRMEAVGQLTSGLAHDFNNLLGVVIGNLDLVLERSGDDAELSKLVERAIAGAMHGADLTKRLLAFSRQQSLLPSVVNLNEIMGLMIPMLRRTLGEQTVVEVHLNRDLWLCLIDSTQIQDVILNLAINARDAMPKGGTLTIETENVSLDEYYTAQENELTPGDYVLLAISDTGTGMTPEVLHRAFEPFFTTKGQEQGTGLGLAMVYGFIKQSRGHTKIYSELGHGTTVKIYLPRAMAESPSAVERPVVAAPARGSETVLVVEDSDIVRQVSLDQLASLGYRTLEARNGKEALVLLDHHPEVDLLFTDIIMPGGMTGHDLVKEARKLRPNLKILLTSGYTSPAVANGDPEAERWELINKPFRRVDLAIKLRKVLGKDQD